MAIISIGATPNSLVALPDPSALTVLLQDIDASTTTRSANGTMLRDRIVGGENAKRKLELAWPALRSEPAKQILQAIKDEFFWVKYPDPYTGEDRVAEFYAGDRSVPMYHYNLSGGILWERIGFNLIEK